MHCGKTNCDVLHFVVLFLFYFIVGYTAVVRPNVNAK